MIKTFIWGIYGSFLLVICILPITTQAAESDLNGNGIDDSLETEVIVASSTVLQAGEYTFQNVVIPSGVTLTLQGDPGSSETFKGVNINADNITVESGAHISADEQGFGYQDCPGAPDASDWKVGASHGGTALGAEAKPVYGSAVSPITLGSGSQKPGGGAMVLSVSQTLLVNGILSANGGRSGSGGSINIHAHAIQGSGDISAEGGRFDSLSSFIGPGGGGRVYIASNANSFSGEVTALGGKKVSSADRAGSGTVGFYDIDSGTLLTGHRWQFDGMYGPFLYNTLPIDGSEVAFEDGAIVAVQAVILSGDSEVTVQEHSEIQSATLIVKDTSVLIYGSGVTLAVGDIQLQDTSVLTTLPMKVLDIQADTLHIGIDAVLHTDEKGYVSNGGPGSPHVDDYKTGASHGGIGLGANPKPVYGSATNPTDFGSAGGSGKPGGGALKISVSDTLTNNGLISANGGRSSSGGSILLNVGHIVGAGDIKAAGGKFDSSAVFIGPGAGGRVAMYYDNADT